MRLLPPLLLLLLGGLLKGQSSVALTEPLQSWVFHLEGQAAKSLSTLASEIARAFPFLAQVLPCEQHHYLVCIPHEPVDTKAYHRRAEELHAYIRQQGFTPYLKEGAQVVELAQNCDQLLKPLLTR